MARKGPLLDSLGRCDDVGVFFVSVPVTCRSPCVCLETGENFQPTKRRKGFCRNQQKEGGTSTFTPTDRDLVRNG